MRAPPTEFPTLLKKLRAELGCSQEQLAHQIGLSFATINRWENGKTRPSKLAMMQVDGFCARLVSEGKLKQDLFPNE